MNRDKNERILVPGHYSVLTTWVKEIFLVFTGLLIIISGCTRNKVLLQAPELRDQTPPLNTGFYTVHKADGGVVAKEPDHPFLGNLLYLYKDQFFVDGLFYTGIKGSFLPDYYISSRYKEAEVFHYWYNGEEEDLRGEIVIHSVDPEKILLSVTTPEGQTEQVALKFYKEQLWKPQVKTISIAHRGTCYQPPFNLEGIYPANTIPGFENALRAGYEGFELDVRLTKDKRFLVSHDEDLSVATTIRGSVADKNLDEFKNILVVQSAPIPEKKSSARPAYIAAPIPTMKEVLDEFLEDERLKTIVVDIKPDKDEDIISAAKFVFTDLPQKYQSKILFLTRSQGVARGLRELVPGSDIAIEGSKGTEPLDPEEWIHFYPEAVGKTRQAHNTVSFGANWLLAFHSNQESLARINVVDSICQEYNYKLCYWTFSKDWRIDFLRENELFPNYILYDVPYYKIALQQLQHTEKAEIQISSAKRPLIELDRYPVYKNILNRQIIDFWFQSRQMLEISYGVGEPVHEDIENPFAGIGNLEIKYGRSEIDKYSDVNVEFSERYLFFSYLSSDIHAHQAADNKISTTSYRLGFGANDGLGYTSGRDFSISPYIGQAFVWTRLSEYDDSYKPGEGESLSSDYMILSQYPGRFRFGDRACYGLKSEITSVFQVNFNYETAVVYPRHLFWSWAGSFALSRSGYGLLNHYSHDFIIERPVVGPLLNFVLKSAYLYGYYVLRKNDMNWPFSSDTPLRYEIYNFGVSVVF